MPDTLKPLPCPFCGSGRIVERHGKFMWWCKCEKCGALGGPKPRKVEAIDAWNHRVGEGEKG